MDPMLEIFFFLWMFVLPILAIGLAILIPVAWFFIVPGIARKITWNRFRNCSYHMIADDTGYAYLLATKEEIAEGIVNTKKGWRFLPRPVWLFVKQAIKRVKSNPGGEEKTIVKTKRVELTDEERRVENIMLRKFVWKDTGKPVWLGYAGKVTSANPATLAALQQTNSGNPDAKGYIQRITEYAKGLGQPHRKILTDMLKQLADGINFKEITLIDPTIIKKLYPKMFTPSQLDAFGTNRETRGMKRAGKQYTPIILGGGILIGVIILGIVAIMVLGK